MFVRTFLVLDRGEAVGWRAVGVTIQLERNFESKRCGKRKSLRFSEILDIFKFQEFASKYFWDSRESLDDSRNDLLASISSFKFNKKLSRQTETSNSLSSSTLCRMEANWSQLFPNPFVVQNWHKSLLFLEFYCKLKVTDDGFSFQMKKWIWYWVPLYKQ